MPKWNVAVHFSRIQTNKLVMLFLAMHPRILEGAVRLMNAQGDSIFVNMRHVKSFHFPH
ncbi:hypothetical protein [Peribacillus sp. V2I11]|uniref:hypothetical protein n=1 Tax=Peribacillus sp. V2I11 TaxID=3042277 RepID=UPI0027824C4D|nr:hypothetical protein [Peribacillus sp. V2I11]MDQ0883040.1 hypothetical protein [Peribacillus sp. V2I11]